MAWFGQKAYNDIQGRTSPSGVPPKYRIADIGCFITAFCNLEQKFGKTITPPELNRVFRDRGIYVDVDDKIFDDVGWASITAYDGQVQVVKVGGAGWPESPNSIVKFSYKSPKTGAATTHFCLVADPGAHTIVDSWDGAVHTPGYYGEPVAWATYANIIPQPVVIPPVAVSPSSSATTGALVKLEKGDTITAIALRYGFGAQEVLDHNGLTWDDARHLPVGYQLRLPIAKAPAPASTGYTVEILDTPRKMHTNKDTSKWGFGNVKEWKDFVSNGSVPANTNVELVAIANVLVSGQAAAYYLDALALGDYKATNKLANTIGINWADLTDGEYSAPVTAPAVQTVEEPAQPAETPETRPVKVTIMPDVPTATHNDIDPAQVDNKPNQWKTTYKPWAKPATFLMLQNGYAYELDGRRANKPLHRNQAVAVAGSFMKDGKLWYRPDGAVKASLWWGIDPDNTVSEAEVFNTAVSLPEKVAMKYVLSHKEKIVVLFSRFAASYTKLIANIKKK